MNDPSALFKGTIIIIAPHMDDEILACGGLIAKLPGKERIHLIYATDGMKSPSPIIPWRDSITPDLGGVRIQESKSAMSLLGVPNKNLHFLRFPEAQLKKNIEPLKGKILKIITRINPDHIFVPFRFDRHPDHLIVNRVVLSSLHQGYIRAKIVEYFVYFRWKLLPAQDIRKYIKPVQLVEIAIDDVAREKRTVLNCFKSQTTIFYPWQTRPILTSNLLDEESRNPEYFLLYDPSYPGTSVFIKSSLWIRIVHRIEPFLKKWKYLTGAYIKRMIHSIVGK